MFDTNDPSFLWLVITNFAMAAVVLICVVVLGAAVLREVAVRLRRTATAPGTTDDHAFQLPELGLTMADGGEREDDSKEPQRDR